MTRKLFLLPVLVLFTMLPNVLRAQTISLTFYDDFTTSQTTSNPGADPGSPLLQGPEGYFYGAASYGGKIVSEICRWGCGAIYQTEFPGTPAFLYEFTGGADGFAPNSGLILGSDGNFYGTTAFGGDAPSSSFCGGGCGTIFKMTPSGNLTTLYTFSGADGEAPLGSLLQGTDGNFYGVTFYGGNTTLCTANGETLGCGTLFQFNPTTNVLTTLYAFNGTTDQGGPQAGLIEASNGNIYGTSIGLGGTVSTECPAGCGSIFKYNLTAKKFSTTYTFSGPDGSAPDPYLWEGSVGDLFGLTSEGGSASSCVAGPGGCGTIFTYSLSTETLTTLYNFTGSDTDGYGSSFGLFQAGDGKMYGNGMAPNVRTIFSVTPAGVYTNLTVSEEGPAPNAETAFVQGANGSLYGAWPYLLPQNYTDCSDGDWCGDLVSGSLSTNPPPAVQITATPSAIPLGQSATLSWQVLNASSLQLQQCYAYSGTGGGSGWSGKQSGTPASGVYSGSGVVTPIQSGAISYSLVCGGIETGIATVTVGATTTTLNANPTSVAGGTPITLTASVAGAGATPTGTAEFFNGITLIGSAPLNGDGVAIYSMSTAALYEGNYPITATYSGSSMYASSTSVPITIDITSSRYQSSTLIGSSGLTVSQGSSLTLSTRVAAVGSTLVPTGTVTFTSNGTTIGTVRLNSSDVGSLTVRNVDAPIGPYPIIGTYSGDANFLPSVSAVLQVVIKYGTHCPFAAAAAGASGVALASTVTSAGDGTPTGTVTFSVGSLTLGSATLNSSGVATYSASSAGLAAGNYAVTATYSGDANNNTSSATSVVSLLAHTTTTASASPSTVTPPGNVTLTANVTRSSGTVNSGKVTFYVGTLEIGSGTVTNGTASFTASSKGIAAGNYPVTARYVGDALDAASAAPNITVVVK